MDLEAPNAYERMRADDLMDEIATVDQPLAEALRYYEVQTQHLAKHNCDEECSRDHCGKNQCVPNNVIEDFVSRVNTLLCAIGEGLGIDPKAIDTRVENHDWHIQANDLLKAEVILDRFVEAFWNKLDEETDDAD